MSPSQPRERALGRDDLIAGYYTISGSLAGAGIGEPARAGFEERVAAAAAAGYVGIGLLSDDYAHQLDLGLSDADMVAMLDHYGIRVEEIEFSYDWAYDDERAARARLVEERLLRMADVFHPHHLSLGEVNPPEDLPPFEVVVERFGRVCDRAAEHGVDIAFEFLPWTGVPDAGACWRILEAADRPNGAMVFDVWHYFRGAEDEDQVRQIPPEKVIAVAISDGAEEVVGDLIEDTTTQRLLPGEGSFDLVRIIRLLDELGVDAPISVEILSHRQNARPTQEAASVAYRAARDLLTRTRPG
jgi:sugar phosphate isomerase/epimerase